MRPAACLALALAAAGAGCATAQRPDRWAADPGPFADQRHTFEVDVPPGWMRDTAERNLLLVTRDGPSLQRLQAGAVDAGRPLGIGDGTRLVAEGMTADELGQLFIDDVRVSAPDVQVVERGPATLGGHPATRVVASYLDPLGLRRRAAFCGAVVLGRAYYVVLFAPERHYHALDLPVLELVARRFRVVAGTGSP